MSYRRLFAYVVGIGLAVSPLAAHAASSAAVHGVRGMTAASAVSVDLFHPSATRAHDSSLVTARPFRRAGTRPLGGPASIGTATAFAAAAPAAVLTQVVEFPLDSLDMQVNKFGAGQAVEPPDTMLAAGPTSLVETVNSTASIWTKTGALTAFVDFNKVLPMPAGFSFSDPRVLYDTASGRWFFSGLGFSLNDSSLVFLGVSKTSDPGGGFFLYKVAQTSNGQLHDQPKIGVSDDKVVISWNDFCCGILGTFRGAETFVFQKSTLLTGAVTPVFFVGPNPNQSSPVPAQSLTSTSTEVVTFNGGGFVGVLEINGTPAANNVTITETDLPIPATTSPPRAMQPGGTINTNDDRFLSSTWRNGDLWVSGNDGCTPAGSTAVRACLRLIEISAITTGGMTPSLTQSFDVGQAGVDVYYPAVTQDPSDNVFVSFSASASSLNASAAVLDILAGAPHGTFSGAKLFQTGAKKYGGTRWGDYSAISVDPATSAVWAAAEYSAAGSARDWGTAAAELTP